MAGRQFGEELIVVGQREEFTMSGFGGGLKRLGVHFSSSELARRRDDGESGRWRVARQLRLSHECLGRAFRQIGKRSFVYA